MSTSETGTTRPLPSLLVVDDDASILYLLTEILGLDYEIRIADSAEAALDAVEAAGAFDGAIVDAMMGGMDGFELVELLRARRETARMPIIMLTALDDPDHRQRAQEVGVDAYVTKPFEPELLEATLSIHVPAGSIFP